MNPPPQCPDFILAETTDGLILSYRGEEFTVDDDMRKDLIAYLEIQSRRDKVLDELKRDLKTRFVSSDSQWGRGRNSGLLECCNIIDEYLRQAGEP